MNIHVGLMRSHLGWETLLSQEGVSYSLVEQKKLHGNWYSAVVLNANTEKKENDALRKYLKNGGAILTSASFFSNVFPSKTVSKKISYLLPEFPSCFSKNSLIDVWTFGNVLSLANSLPTNRKSFSTFCGELYGGTVVCFPFDAGALIERTEAKRKYCYAATTRLPAEKVSVVSKGEVRKLVASALEYVHHQRNIPYIHLWYYPNAQKNIFSFRIDSDYGTEAEIFSLYERLREHHIRATWFLDVKSHQNFLRRFQELEHQELSLHCYEHQTYDAYQRNKTNIKHGITLLTAEGIFPKGFASPFGEWNNGMQRAVEEFGFEYSSEFSFDYDNFPSFSMRGKQFGTSLQIPIHPICNGSLRSARMKETEMFAYYESCIAKKMICNEPLFFYHHPNDAHFNVWEKIFAQIAHHNITQYTFSEFAHWWKQRLRNGAMFSTENNIPTIEKGVLYLPKFEKEIALRISLPNKNEALLTSQQMQNEIHLASLDVTPAQSLQTSDEILRTRKFSPRLWNQKVRIYLRKKLR
ncbi:MAG: hypothetical protein FJ218_07230 [Ignavibacteria bacterium]|nr:hypothetical protein [Ignavibacteria bacterium]